MAVKFSLRQMKTQIRFWVDPAPVEQQLSDVPAPRHGGPRLLNPLILPDHRTPPQSSSSSSEEDRMAPLLSSR